MARTKKAYTNGQKRGGTPGKPTDTSFGVHPNRAKTKKNYASVAVRAGFR
jgi:hypothetical protein